MKANRFPQKKTVAVTAGDPKGIGPEIIKKALQLFKPDFPLLIIGNRKDFPGDYFIDINNPDGIEGSGVYFLEVSESGSDPSFSFVRTAVDLALKKKISAIVTAPINKEKWKKSGHNFMGHTEYLVNMCGTRKHAMFFWSDNIKTALYTTHIPLKDVFGKLNIDDLADFCTFVHDELTKIAGKDFKILVSGLNPHAGEGGNMGNEEADVISPVVKMLENKFSIEGPYPPDTIFLKALSVPDSVVISLYHDQGLIPFKLLKVNSGVNVTLGLPFVRTSPDHGTAYDIAGKGIADPGSMIEAIKLAADLSDPS